MKQQIINSLSNPTPWKAEIDRLSAENTSLKSQLSQKDNIINSIGSQKDSEINGWKNYYNSAQSQVQNLQSQINNLNSSLIQKQSEIQLLNQQLNEIEKVEIVSESKEIQTEDKIYLVEGSTQTEDRVNSVEKDTQTEPQNNKEIAELQYKLIQAEEKINFMANFSKKHESSIQNAIEKLKEDLLQINQSKPDILNIRRDTSLEPFNNKDNNFSRNTVFTEETDIGKYIKIKKENKDIGLNKFLEPFLETSEKQLAGESFTKIDENDL